MRWELNDLARRLDNQPAAVELHEGLALSPASSVSGLTPDGLRMLQAIDELPEDEREVFDLVRIQGMTQVEAAEVLGVSAETVKRRLNRGLRLLAEQLADLRPGRIDRRDSISDACRLRSASFCVSRQARGRLLGEARDGWRSTGARSARGDPRIAGALRRRCVRPAPSC